VAITRLSGIGYAFLVWRWPTDAPIVGAICAAAALLIIDVLTTRRRPFAAIAAAVFIVHLGALPPSANLLGQYLPLQIVVATLEFLLLTMAGFRYVQALLWKFRALIARAVHRAPLNRAGITGENQCRLKQHYSRKWFAAAAIFSCCWPDAALLLSPPSAEPELACHAHHAVLRQHDNDGFHPLG
jgi:hypothetical protein